MSPAISAVFRVTRAVRAPAIAFALLTGVACASSAPAPDPNANAKPAGEPKDKNGLKLSVVTDKYFDVTVADPYRWLEDTNDADTKAFIDDQNKKTRALLDALPGRAQIEARLRTLFGAGLVQYIAPVEANGQLFALKNAPPKQQPFLVVLPSAEDVAKERVVVDPNVLDPTGALTIDWYRPSPDGKKVALSLSTGGSEAGDVHIFDAETGKEMDVVQPRVQGGTAGGDLAWLKDGSGYYYTRYPRTGEKTEADMSFFVEVWQHVLGQPLDKDTYEVGREFPRISEYEIETSPQSDDVLVTVQNGDGGEFMHWLKRKGAWVQLTQFADQIIEMRLAPKDDLVLVSHKDAPRGKVLLTPRQPFDLTKAKVLVAETADTVITEFGSGPGLVVMPPLTKLEGNGRLYYKLQRGGPSELRTVTFAGVELPPPTQFPVGAVSAVVPLKSGDVLFGNGSFVEPLAWMRYKPRPSKALGTTTKTAISTVVPVKLDGITVAREMAASKDGTQVPVNIVLPKGRKVGEPGPIVVTGYGGYGVNIEPRFSLLRAFLLEQGVAMAIVNLRGGGEFGEAWHKAGNLLNKQNVFDDFIGAVEHLKTTKTADPARVGITGGSNGGLLMGAVITQRPDLAKAVVSDVGIYDMLRVETDPNGAFNTTEFGTVKDEAQFRALNAYSPLLRVKGGTAYPAILMSTGVNDPRVAPWHSRKMIATLQAATSATNPIVLRTSFNAGHGMGSSLDELVSQQTDMQSFMLAQLGVTVQ